MAPEQVVLETDKVYVEDRALVRWHMLDPGVRAALMKILEHIVDQPPEAWPIPEAGPIKRWWPERDVFVYPVDVGPDKLLVFFYIQDGRIHIDSLTWQETIDYYSGKKS